MTHLLCRPEVCAPPHRVTHSEHRDTLMEAFRRGGWDPACPALVGYREGACIQLLSGSHRWDAARRVGLLIPVAVVEKRDVEEAWGDLVRWQALMARGDSQDRDT